MNEYVPLPVPLLIVLIVAWVIAARAAAKPHQTVAFTTRRLPRALRPTSIRREVRLTRIQAVGALFILSLIILADLVARLW